MNNFYKYTAILLLSAFAFTSCTKKSDYTCTCSVPGSSESSSSVLVDISLEDADAACANGTDVEEAECVLTED